MIWNVHSKYSHYITEAWYSTRVCMDPELWYRLNIHVLKHCLHLADGHTNCLPAWRLAGISSELNMESPFLQGKRWLMFLGNDHIFTCRSNLYFCEQSLVPSTTTSTWLFFFFKREAFPTQTVVILMIMVSATHASIWHMGLVQTNAFQITSVS